MCVKLPAADCPKRFRMKAWLPAYISLRYRSDRGRESERESDRERESEREIEREAGIDSWSESGSKSGDREDR